MSIDAASAVSGISPVAPVSSDSVPVTVPQRAPDVPFSQVLQRHLEGPRRDIASVRSEIAAIRAGQPFWRGAGGIVDGGGFDELDSRTASKVGFRDMPGWLESQLSAQATGDTQDPYGWRGMSRSIAERIIGPGYGGLFERQIDQESGFNPDVVYGLRVSSAGAEGIAQLMPQYYANVDRLDPRSALTAGAQTMRHYLDVWDGDVRRALASYNAGLGRVQQLVGAHGESWEAALPQETRHYLSAILGSAQPRFQGLVTSDLVSNQGAVFGGRGPGGVLTSPLATVTAQRSTGTSMDFFGTAGADVLAPTDGVVVASSAGAVVLDHGNGWRTTLEGVIGAPPVGTTLLRSQAIGTLAGGGLLRLTATAQDAPVDVSKYLLRTA